MNSKEHDKLNKRLKNCGVSDDDINTIHKLVSTANMGTTLQEGLERFSKRYPKYNSLQRTESNYLSRGHCDSMATHLLSPLEIIVDEWSDDDE